MIYNMENYLLIYIFKFNTIKSIVIFNHDGLLSF